MRPFLLAVLVAVMLSSCIAVPVGPGYSGYAPAPVVVWRPEPAPYYCCYAYPYGPYGSGYRYGYRR
jgi:hypothetical protein